MSMSNLRHVFKKSPFATALPILALLILSSAALGTTPGSRSPKHTLGFKNRTSGICDFKLQGYEFTKPIESAVVFGVTQIFETYKDTFGFEYPEDFKVKVTIIADHDKFLSYQKAQAGKIISQGGYYSGEHMETVVWQNKDLKTMLGVLFHEASHMIMMHKVPWCPGWMNEGMSVYFEGFNVIGKNKRVVLNQNRISWCKHWVDKGFPKYNGHPITLKEYIGLNYDQWVELREQDANAAYTIGYVVVYYMMSSSQTEKVLKQLLWELRDRGPSANSIAVINKHYPGGFEKLERIWQRWVPRARKYRPLRALKKVKKTDPPSDSKQQPKS
jgi:hypothetical protein